MKANRRLSELSWLLVPIGTCLLLALITLAALEIMQRKLTGDSTQLHEMYYLARNLMLALCMVTVALVLWLTRRVRRYRRHLAERDMLYHQVLNHLPLMVRIRDLNGQVRFENLATLGSEVADWGSLDLLDANQGSRLPPVSRVVWEAQRDALQKETSQERFLEIGDVEQADYRAYRLISFPIYDVDGRARALGSMAIVETAQARDRRLLASLAADLERQVQSRTAELSAAKEQAEAATQAKATFLANMSHEIRSPLNALVGLSHLARRSNRDPQLENYLGKILKSAEHLQNVVGDILDFSKIEAGEMRIERVEFSLQRLVDSVVDIVWERARDKPLQLIVDIDPRLPRQFYGDPLRIVQILINFMDNAIKFTERGSISLRVLLGDTQAERYGLHFEIQDSGVGIPAHRLDEIFKPFQQLDDSITRRYGGSGLGLAICAQLTTLLGGQLTARSELDVGSLFRLSLELEAVPGKPDGEEGGDALRRVSIAGRHVLLVEDDALNREVATEQLSALGLQVSTAVNGAEALRYLANDPSVDLVLLDVQMPVMDGLETIRVLRTRQPELPVIALTANNLRGDRERCLQAGMSDYLAKPIDPVQLGLLLERWLSQPLSLSSEQSSTNPQHPFSTIAGLDHEAALARLLGNHDLYLSLLSRFVEDYADVAQSVRESLQHGRFNEAQEVLHRFKSLAGTLGAETLQALSTELELTLREERAWTDAYDSFAEEFNRLLEDIKAALASTGQ